MFYNQRYFRKGTFSKGFFCKENSFLEEKKMPSYKSIFLRENIPHEQKTFKNIFSRKYLLGKVFF